MEKIYFDTFKASCNIPSSILMDEGIFESRLNLYEDKYGALSKYKEFDDCVHRHNGLLNFIKEGKRLNSMFEEIGVPVRNKVKDYCNTISPEDEYFSKIPLSFLPNHDYLEIDMFNAGFELYHYINALDKEYIDITKEHGVDDFFSKKKFRQKFHFNHIFINGGLTYINVSYREILSDNDSPIIQFLRKYNLIDNAMQKCDALFFDITGHVDEIKDYFGKDTTISGYVLHIRHHKITEHDFLDTEGKLHRMLLSSSPYGNQYVSNMENSAWYPQMHRLMKGETVTPDDRSAYKNGEIVLLPELTKIDNDMLLN